MAGSSQTSTSHPRGFLGAELEADAKDAGRQDGRWPAAPADKAGLKVGDRIETAKGTSHQVSRKDLLEAVKKLPEGTTLKLSVKRGEDTKDITVELGKGL